MFDFAALSDIQIAIFLFAFAAVLLGIAIGPARRRKRSFNPYVPYKPPVLHRPVPDRPALPQIIPATLADTGYQMNAVMGGSFEKRRLMNRSEYRVFQVIEQDVTTANRGFRVFAQTCLGEVLNSPDHDAFHSINSKRVDILIVDRGGWPVLAVEYQGPGHYVGTAAARDAIKKEALRKAGVRYLEVLPADSDDQIRTRVREYLDWPVPKAAQAAA
jgi:hypothetical protein